LTEPINFFNEGVSYIIPNRDKISAWIADVIATENFRLHSLNIIFCSDGFLLSINNKYLDRDYLTDVIAFDQSDDEGMIEGDIYISIDRIKENAAAFKQAFEKELNRVIVHGVLHLMGYDDKQSDERRVMLEKEEACLSLLNL